VYFLLVHAHVLTHGSVQKKRQKASSAKSGDSPNFMDEVVSSPFKLIIVSRKTKKIIAR
jgi:hypothetical protein